MTATVSRSSALTVPPSQNTAPVLEFRCLFTHDVRRKAKRWRDGFLRFHTFNKRVMVYDDGRNYVGDTHWKSQGGVQEGEELTLDGGVLVEVAEATGASETDLAPLFQKKTCARQGNEAPVLQPLPNVRGFTMRDITQSRHKPLSTVLGTPKGTYGKAILPSISPYEARKLNKDYNLKQEQVRKRQKTAGRQPWENGPNEPERVQLKPTETRSLKPPVRMRAHKVVQKSSAPGLHPVLNYQQQLSDEVTGASLENEALDIGFNGIPVAPERASKHLRLPTGRSDTIRRRKSRNGIVTPQTPPSSPPAEAMERSESLADGGSDPVPQAEGEVSNVTGRIGPGTHRNPRLKRLRMRTGRSRKTLLCQSLNSSRLRLSSTNDQTRDLTGYDSRQSNAKNELALVGNPSTSSQTKAENENIASTRRSFDFRAQIHDHEALEIAGNPSEPYGDGRHSKAWLAGNTSSLVADAMEQGRDRMWNTVSEEVATADASSVPVRDLVSPVREMEHTLTRSPAPSSRQFSRVQSESSVVELNRAVDSAHPGSTSARTRQTASNRPFRRSKSTMESASTTSNKDTSVIEEPTLPVEDKDIGPWSSEAFYLMAWRPPDRDENGKKIVVG